jgi:predicted alpha/beta superfamily hydrolase
MARSFFILLLLSFSLHTAAQFTIHIDIVGLPPEPRTYDLYISGSFNNWNPADEKFMFQRKGNGQFYLDVKLPAGNYEYKITRGSWKEVECNADGSNIANRRLHIKGEEVISISVANWLDHFPTLPQKRSTASKNVRVADSTMYMPQLDRQRKIQVYLPEGYAGSNKRYPVLYMHDGQNLFDVYTSYAGEWGLDEYMDSTTLKKCIIVSIDNGSRFRTNEYCPWDFTLYPDSITKNKGEGKLYAAFLAKTLKPFIDRNYRTMKDKKNTWVAGGSMGGLISLFAVLQYPEVFGGVGVFSPSVWICKNQLIAFIKRQGKKVNSRIYFFCSKEENPTMAPEMLLAFQQLAAVSKSKMSCVIVDKGPHHESTWRKALPGFYEFLVR